MRLRKSASVSCLADGLQQARHNTLGYEEGTVHTPAFTVSGLNDLLLAGRTCLLAVYHTHAVPRTQAGSMSRRSVSLQGSGPA